MPFGQLVIGSAGSGKSTLCSGFQQFFRAVSRKSITVNLDPGNEVMPYDADIDVRSWTTVEKCMKERSLGPNGALVYCMGELQSYVNEISKSILTFIDRRYNGLPEDINIIFDAPGQIELYTQHSEMQILLESLLNKLDFEKANLCIINVLDSTVVTAPSDLIFSSIIATSALLHFELPQITLLTKVDLLKDRLKDTLVKGILAEGFSSLLWSSYSLSRGQTMFLTDQYTNFLHELADILDQYDLVTSLPVVVEDKKSMLFIISQIDAKNGYASFQSQLKFLSEIEKADMTPQQRNAALNAIVSNSQYLSGNSETSIEQYLSYIDESYVL